MAPTTRMILVNELEDSRFEIVVSTKNDGQSYPTVETVQVDAWDVEGEILRRNALHVDVKVSLDAAPYQSAGVFMRAFALRRRGMWVRAEEFYADAKRTGRYGGEVDFGCFWRLTGRDRLEGFDQYARARVSWIRNTGEVYAYISGNAAGRRVGLYLLLGRTRANDGELIERALEGWGEACMAAESLHWIRRGLDMMSRTYPDDTAAARAFGRQHGYAGTGGGWIAYRGQQVGQGWWSCVGQPLQRAGGIVYDDTIGRYLIVDTRPIQNQQALSSRRAV